jgi:hypothetical protein
MSDIEKTITIEEIGKPTKVVLKKIHEYPVRKDNLTFD